MNAEIVSGTVNSVSDAVQWLMYTYLYVRMIRNPVAYGIKYDESREDPSLRDHCSALIRTAARKLDHARMIRFNSDTGSLGVTDLGRMASHFYICHGSIEVFNDILLPHMSDAELFAAVSRSKEFDNIRIRQEETSELKTILRQHCQVEVSDAIDSPYGKVNVLLQVHIRRCAKK